MNDYNNGKLIGNNVFGVEFYGIKIIKLPDNENGVFYISIIKNNKNDILNPKDEIIFIYDYEDLKIGNAMYIFPVIYFFSLALFYVSIITLAYYRFSLYF